MGFDSPKSLLNIGTTPSKWQVCSPFVARVMEARIVRRVVFAIFIFLQVGAEAENAAFVAIRGFRDAIAAARVTDNVAHVLVSSLHRRSW